MYAVDNYQPIVDAGWQRSNYEQDEVECNVPMNSAQQQYRDSAEYTLLRHVNELFARQPTLLENISMVSLKFDNSRIVIFDDSANALRRLSLLQD